MYRGLIFFLFIFSSWVLTSQSKSTFNFRHFTTSNGLSNNSITTISQDKHGQIWVGTRNGLNKFNGLKNTVYRTNLADSTSISSTNILNIIEDNNGFVWVGTLNGLNRYNPRKKSFKKYFKNSKQENSLSNNLIFCSAIMPNGDVWFGTGNGISVYNFKQDNFKRLFKDVITDRKNKKINHIHVDSNKNVWIATPTGIRQLFKNANSTYTASNYYIPSFVKKISVNKILEISPGLLGIATKYNGYLIFSTKTKKFKHLENSIIPTNVYVEDLKKDNDGNLWLATHNGVFIIAASGDVTLLKAKASNSVTLSQNLIKTIFKDVNGSIWLGTGNSGINVWSKSNQNFINIKNNLADDDTANSIIKDNLSNIYYGTVNGNVNKIDSTGKVSKVISVPLGSKTISYSVLSMQISDDNNVLSIGTATRGLIAYNLITKKEDDLFFSNKLKLTLKNTGIYTIVKDKYNNYWFGTFGLGIVKYNIKTQKILIIKKPVLTTNIIKSLLVEDNGTIWAGGLGGVHKLITKNDKVYSSLSFLDKDKHYSYNITKLHQDSYNNLWIGTRAKGLYKHNGKDVVKVNLSKKEPIYSVYSILQGGADVLWLSTEKGIVKFNVKTNKVTLFEQGSIDLNNDFKSNSGLKVGKSKFYFGSLNGITYFNSNKLFIDNYAPKTLLLDLKIQNKIVKVGDQTNILTNNINFTKQLDLDYTNSNFSISYALPNYTYVNGNSYAYRLKGLNNNWIYTKKTEAFFTLQNSGKYVFEVKGANHNGVWNNKITSINIFVKPKPWKTWWAYSLYVLLVILILFSVYWGLQLKYKLQLQSLEKKRIEDANNDKLDFFTNISHEFRTPLTLILGPLQKILNEYSGSKDTYNKLKIIEGSTNHLLRLINRLMDFRKFENNQFKLEAAQGNIVKFLKEIFLSFTEFAKIDNYKYEFNTDSDSVLVYFDRYKLERVFYNIISNAFRYTKQPGNIKISITQDDVYVIISVKDNGVGIADEYLDKIFDRFFEVPIHNKSNNDYQRGTGIGLSIASNIVKLHHGEIQVNKVYPSGSNFVVKLKKGKAHLKSQDIIKNFKASDDLSQYVKQISPKNYQDNTRIESLLTLEKPYTVLVVEDNITLRSFIKEILKANYNIIEAENGEVALNLASKHLPDLIISDVIMPKMVGTELCSRIKTNFETSHIPVILLTSRSSLVYKFQGLESGADDYLSKPFELKELVLKVKNILETKNRLKEKLLSRDNLTLPNASLTSIDEKMFNKAYVIVKNNIANEAFNVNQFSEDLGVSRSMLFVKIKAWANLTPKDFIQEIRLKYAARLLEVDKFTIAEISQKVGFKRQKYFSACFQKKYGLTPTKYSQKFNKTE